MGTLTLSNCFGNKYRGLGLDVMHALCCFFSYPARYVASRPVCYRRSPLAVLPCVRASAVLGLLLSMFSFGARSVVC